MFVIYKLLIVGYFRGSSLFPQNKKFLIISSLNIHEDNTDG